MDVFISSVYLLVFVHISEGKERLA
jgi:hypothetical protein